MTRPCEKYRSAIREVMGGGATWITDELALHLDTCSECRRVFDLGKIDLPIESFEVLDETARRRIVEALGSARLRMPRSRRWAAGLTAAAALIVIAIGAAFFSGGRPTTERVADALVEDHIRYLNHPDRKGGGSPPTLESYLESYVDFPVELAIPPTTRLTGGRRCFVLGRRVALLFYETSDGPASYFVFAANGMRPPGIRCSGAGEFSCAASHGYHLVSWQNAGLLHVIVGSRERSLLDMARSCRPSTTG